MATTPKQVKRLPKVPPAVTKLIDSDGRATREFTDYLLKTKEELEKQIAVLRQALGI